jgi:geranylgeranyl diphosphate synthase type I
LDAILQHRTALADVIEAQTQGSELTRLGAGWHDDPLARLQSFATAGKLLRGCLTCFMYEAFTGRRPTQDVLRTAAALELIHSALLIHDDVMDQDNMRRGRPSIHHQYQTLADTGGLIDSPRVGEGLAVSLADMSVFLAFGLLGELKLKAVQKSALMGLFSSHLATVCAGQMLDVYLGALATTPDEHEVNKIMQAKTAGYSVTLPLRAGAILAGQGPATLKTLEAIGSPLGLIFQIRDDELGVFGDAKTLGKPVGSDIKSGKKTLLHSYLFRACSAREKAKLSHIFGNPEAAEADIDYVRRTVERHHVPELIGLRVAALSRQASRAINRLDISTSAKTELLSFLDFCATRRT